MCNRAPALHPSGCMCSRSILRSQAVHCHSRFTEEVICRAFQSGDARATRHRLSTTGRCCCMVENEMKCSALLKLSTTDSTASATPTTSVSTECRRENGTGAEYVCSVAQQSSVLVTRLVIVLVAMLPQSPDACH